MPTPLRYASHPSWTRYRELLARRFGIHVASEPIEREQDWRGHRLHIDEWSASGSPLGTLIFVHGGGGHGRLFAPYAEWAVALGWRVLAPDLPGFGLTRVRPGWDWDAREWPECVAKLATQAAGQGPVILVGLSLGGITALRAAQLCGVVRGVVVTTLIDLRDPETLVRAARWHWLGRLTVWLARWAPWLLDRLPLPLGLATPIGSLTSDLELRRYFETDRLLGRRIVWGRLFRSLHAYEPPRPNYDLACPLLLVHPGADEWTPTAMSMPIFAGITSEKRLHELSNGAHLPLEQPAHDELREQVGAWLRQVAGL